MSNDTQKKVYIVTHGDYSDYRIDGVFSTKERANEFIRTRVRYGDIEEWDVDAFDELIRSGLYRYIVWFDEDGNADLPPICRPDESDLAQPEVTEVNDSMRYRPSPLRLRVDVWARDDEHAIKVASEKRAQYLAERAGIT
jgi:hypothetical protein